MHIDDGPECTEDPRLLSHTPGAQPFGPNQWGVKDAMESIRAQPYRYGPITNKKVRYNMGIYHEEQVASTSRIEEVPEDISLLDRIGEIAAHHEMDYDSDTAISIYSEFDDDAYFAQTGKDLFRSVHMQSLQHLETNTPTAATEARSVV